MDRFQSFKRAGTWWLPTHPEAKIMGDLEYHPAVGLQLSLTQAFPDARATRVSKSTPTVFGFIAEGPVTLHECGRVGTSDERGEASHEYHAGVLLLGAHLDYVGEPWLAQMDLAFSGFARWADREFVQRRVDTDPKGRRVRTLKTRFNPEFHTRLAGNRGAVHVFDEHVDPLDPAPRDPTMRGRTWVSVVPTRDQSLSDLRLTATRIQTFLSMAMGQPAPLMAAKGKIRPVLPKKPANEVSIIWAPMTTQIPTAPDRSRMLYVPTGTEPNPVRLITKWLDFCQECPQAVRALAVTRTGSDDYVDTAFLRLTHALAAYHNLRLGGFYMTKAGYTKLANSLIQALPSRMDPELAKALTRRIRSANVLALDGRLRMLLDALPPDIMRFVAKKPQSFTRRAFEEFLAFADPFTQRIRLGEAELEQVTRRLDAWWTGLVLQEVGASHSAIRASVRRLAE